MFTTGSLAGTNNCISNLRAIVSRDGRHVARVCRQGDASRLLFARAEPGDPVSSTAFPGTWADDLRHGKVGDGAFFNIDVGLVYASFVDGSITSLSTRPVRDGNFTIADDGSALFLDLAGADRTVGPWSLHRWSPQTPAVPPTVLASGTGKLDTCFRRYPAGGAATGPDRTLCDGCYVQANATNIISYDVTAYAAEATYFVEDLATGARTPIAFPGADPSTADPTSIRVSRDGKRVFRVSYDFSTKHVIVTSGDVADGAPVTKVATLPFEWNQTPFELVPVLDDSALLRIGATGAVYLIR